MFAVETVYIVFFSSLFIAIGLTGIIGNSMVKYVILVDGKMRKSMTNILIFNLALSDTLIMLLGIPEIVQFMLNRGWLMGGVMCKIDRSLLVCCLYVSVTSLLALCIER